MPRLWESLPDTSLDDGHILQEFKALEGYGLVFILPADDEYSGTRLLIVLPELRAGCRGAIPAYRPVPAAAALEGGMGSS